jgi:hypothetical protein
MVIDGFELMRERVYAGDGKPKVRIKFVGDAQGVSL